MENIRLPLKIKATQILFIISLLCFFFLNHFTDLAIDDFSYKFIFSKDPNINICRVRTFSDLLTSQYNHYFIMNGRLLANGLAQLFLMTENKIWFNIANTVMFGILQILILLCAGIKFKNISINSYVFLLIFLWFLIPGPNHTFLWLTGSFNYLWATVLILAFLYLHNILLSYTKTISFLWYPLLFIAGFIAGTTHEVLSVGVSGALMLYYLLNRRKFNGAVIPMVLGFILGTVFIVAAPGNMVRMQNEGVREGTFFLLAAQRFWGFMTSIKSMMALVILIFLFVLLAIFDKGTFTKLYHDYSLYLWSIFFSLCFILLAGAYQERVFFGVAIFSITIIISLLRYKVLFFKHRLVQWIILITAAVMLFEFILVVRVLRENKINFDNDEQTWITSEENVFELREKKLNRFVSTGLGGYDRYFWSNIVMSQYYGKNYLIFLPSELYNNLFLSNKLIEKQNLVVSTISVADSMKYNFFQLPGGKFIVIPANGSIVNQIGKGSFIRYVPYEPVAIQKLNIRQRITKLVYKRLPEMISEEKAPCFGLAFRGNYYIICVAPVIFSTKSVDNLEIFKDDKQSPYILKLRHLTSPD